MKTVNKILQILAAVAGLATLVFFFFTFAKFSIGGETVGASGLEIAFGAKVYNATNIARSAKVLLCFWLSVIGVVLSGVTFFKKSYTVKYWASGINLGTAIFMLVILLGRPDKFVDRRPFAAEYISYGPAVALITVAILCAAVFSIAHLFLNDRIEVLASKGVKKSILAKLLQFFKDYKSECKKIVWPGIKVVVKNTGIVLIMCAIIGVLIWLLDLGLISLLDAVWQ